MTASSLLPRAALAAMILGSAVSVHAQSQTPQTQTPPSASPPAAQGAATLDMAFKQGDTNADGKLSNEELAQFPSLAPRFQDLDKDKDGFVSSEEFSSGVTVKAN